MVQTCLQSVECICLAVGVLFGVFVDGEFIDYRKYSGDNWGSWITLWCNHEFHMEHYYTDRSINIILMGQSWICRENREKGFHSLASLMAPVGTSSVQLLAYPCYPAHAPSSFATYEDMDSIVKYTLPLAHNNNTIEQDRARERINKVWNSIRILFILQVLHRLAAL